MREDTETSDSGLGSAKTDGTLVTYGTGFTLSGSFQAVNIRCEVTLPTREARVKKSLRTAEKLAEEHLAKRVPHAKKLLAELIKMRAASGK